MSGKSDYQQGRDDASNGDWDPPGDSLLETLSNETNRYYEGRRENYQEGYDDRKNEIEHGHRK